MLNFQLIDLLNFLISNSVVIEIKGRNNFSTWFSFFEFDKYISPIILDKNFLFKLFNSKDVDLFE